MDYIDISKYSLYWPVNLKHPGNPAMTLKKTGVHALCWIIFITYEVSVSRYMGDPSSYLAFALFYVIDIVLFYCNADYVFPKFLPAGTHIPKAAIVILPISIELAIYIYLSVCLNNAFKHIGGVDIFTRITNPVLVTALWRGIYFLGLSIAYWAARTRIQAIKKTQEATLQRENLKKENAILQNAYLQARINPHFLFNTLSFIYNQTQERSPAAADSIAKLSDIMRYALSDIDTDGKVPLRHETDHIKKYIDLNHSRFRPAFYLNAQITDGGSQRIPPLLLMTFVENVFKHGDITDKDHPGQIALSLTNGRLSLYTENRKRVSLLPYTKHLGIENARKRLDNFYGTDRATLSIHETESQFNLTLEIDL